MRREYRLRKGTEFDSVYAKGTVVNGPFVVLRHLPNETGHARWGFAVGKRLAKQAVRRNRLRRRLREIARSLPVIDRDIILTAKAPALTADAAELREAVLRSLRRAGLVVPEEPGR